MPREDWRELESERMRRLRDRDREAGYEEDRDPRDRYDLGQVDYSDMYGYDPRHRTGYRAYDDGRGHPDDGPVRRESEWDYGPERRHGRRRGGSDRVLWAVIMERLDDERRLDLRDVGVDVHDGEVTLSGTVRHKADKRRIEDVADIDGVRNVQNNLRVRDRGRWTFI
jgi:hypothetical protein